MNEKREIVDSLTYLGTSPWPNEANGIGPSLSLFNPDFDNSKSSSWGYSTFYGTPGEINETNYSENYTNIIDQLLSQNDKKTFLEQNFPNPFNFNTTINFYIPNKDNISLKIYDIFGKKIAILINEEKHQGRHKVIFNSYGLPPAVYFYQLQTNKIVLTKRMIIQR